jgi:hypothetical protein
MRVVFLSILFLLAAQAGALVNPMLQPKDLFERHQVVLIAAVKAVDPAAGRVTLVVQTPLKGDLKAAQAVELAFDAAAQPMLSDNPHLKPGAPVVALAKAVGRGQSDRVMLYAGQWYLGRATAADRWAIDREDERMTDTAGQAVPSLAGTWNGSTEMLVRLMQDVAAGTSLFPRRAYVRFKPDLLIDTLDEDRPARGVALYDIDGDGDLDLYACSTGGDRIYLQMKPLVFVNATEWAGLETASVSVSFADVDGDGLADLLSDGLILRGVREGDRLHYEATEWLAAEANENVKHAAFAELNGDGWPDVVVSQAGGGLRAYLHPGKAGEAFVDATAAMGLDQPTHGAGGDGFVTIGDWNDDGRADLFYAAGDGYLLVQNGAGRFEPLEHGVPFDFATGEDDAPGRTGAGFFAPVLNPGVNDLVVPTEDGWRVIANRDGTPVDVTEWGNEISEGSHAHLASIAADFSLDGRVDFYTISGARNGHNRLILHRGYGSFMLADVHKAGEHLFQGPTHTHGGWGIAAGDVDGDAAPDLLLSNDLGQLVVLLNDTRGLRSAMETTTDDGRRMVQVRLAQVTVTGRRGVVGARVTLTDPTGSVVTRQDIGTSTVTGCRSADQVTLAVPSPGEYQLAVRYADGAEVRRSIDLSSSDPVRVEVSRPN